MEKRKPIISKKDWLGLQIALMILVFGFSLVINIMIASDLS